MLEINVRATPARASIWTSTPQFRGLVQKNQLQQDLQMDLHFTRPSQPQFIDAIDSLHSYMPSTPPPHCRSHHFYLFSIFFI
jgi:hypothetical protein